MAKQLAPIPAATNSIQLKNGEHLAIFKLDENGNISAIVQKDEFGNEYTDDVWSRRKIYQGRKPDELIQQYLRLGWQQVSGD